MADAEKIVVAFCGQENSRKYEYTNKLHAYCMNNLIEQPEGIPSHIDERGRLKVLTEFVDENGCRDTRYETLNVFQRSYDYQEWASLFLWPAIKIINFTDPILNIMETLFHIRFDGRRQKAPVTWKTLSNFLPRGKHTQLGKEERYEKRMSLYELEKWLAYEFLPTFKKRSLIDLWSIRHEQTRAKIVVTTDAFTLAELNKLQYEKAIMVFCPAEPEDREKNYYAGKEEFSSFKAYDIITDDQTDIIAALRERIQF